MCSGEGLMRKGRIANIKLVGGLFGRREGWMGPRVKEKGKEDREDREEKEALAVFWGGGEGVLAREERGESESVRVPVGKSRISSS